MTQASLEHIANRGRAAQKGEATGLAPARRLAKRRGGGGQRAVAEARMRAARQRATPARDPRAREQPARCALERTVVGAGFMERSKRPRRREDVLDRYGVADHGARGGWISNRWAQSRTRPPENAAPPSASSTRLDAP